MTIPEEWQGRLPNVHFPRSIMTWEPEGNRIVGQYIETGPISMYQYWKIVRQGSGQEVTIQNCGSERYVRYEDGKLTTGHLPTFFYAIEQGDGLIGFRVPNSALAWDLPSGNPGEEVVLIGNINDNFTEAQKWMPVPSWN